MATIGLKAVVTNNAAAALMFPLALSTAADVGLNVRAVTVAIALAASASFLTPIGYQTNLMVCGPAGYRFSDYARLGVPLTILVVILILVLVPLEWGLTP
jgi:di/tricarboxylate transporter